MCAVTQERKPNIFGLFGFSEHINNTIHHRPNCEWKAVISISTSAFTSFVHTINVKGQAIKWVINSTATLSPMK